MAMSPTSVCASILNDMIGSLIVETITEATATDATSCSPTRSSDDELDMVCRSILSGAITNVERGNGAAAIDREIRLEYMQHGGAALAEAIRLEYDTLTWLAKCAAGSLLPSGEDANEKLKVAYKLFKHKNFAKKLCELDASPALLTTFLERDAFNALDWMDATLKKMPESATRLTQEDGVYDQVLRMTTYVANPAKMNMSVRVLETMVGYGLAPGEYSAEELAVVASKEVAP
eukprot:6670442-Prymnesium_polylepis.1